MWTSWKSEDTCVLENDALIPFIFPLVCKLNFKEMFQPI